MRRTEIKLTGKFEEKERKKLEEDEQADRHME
jgi:hypothetical protein